MECGGEKCVQVVGRGRGEVVSEARVGAVGVGRWDRYDKASLLIWYCYNGPETK